MSDDNNVFFTSAEADDLEEGTYRLHVAIPEDGVDEQIILHEGRAIHEVKALFHGEGVFADLSHAQKAEIAEHLTLALLKSNESSTVTLYEGFKNLLDRGVIE